MSARQALEWPFGDRFNRTDVETVDAVVRWLEAAAGDDADDNLMIEGGILGEHRVC